MKSRAKALLEKVSKLNEEDVPGEIKPDDTPALPNDAAPAPAEQPGEQPADAPDLKKLEDLCGQPDGMAQSLALQEGMCGKYEDMEDTSCFTPETDDDKKAVSEAKYHIREARARMLKIKKK
jgi:hypothetical protein